MERRLPAVRRIRVFLILLCLSLFMNAAAAAGLADEGARIGSSPTTAVEDRRIWEQVAEPVVTVTEDWSISAYRLHVPRILLPGPGADQFNLSMDQLEADMLAEFAAAVSENRPYSPSTEYSVYDDGEILSVLVEVVLSPASIGYVTVTLDLETGAMLDIDELADHFGVLENLAGLMEDTVVKANLDMAALSTIEAAMMEDHWHSVETGTLRLFVDEAGRLSMLLRGYDPGGGYFDAPYPLALPSVDRALNPVFIRVANELGLDVDATDTAGFAAYLGTAISEQTLDEVMKRLWAFSEDYSEYRQPSLLDNSVDTEYGYYLAGNEFYLFIPRYEHTVIRLTQMTLTDDGTLVPLAEARDIAALGMSFAAGNQSEIFPNMTISYTYRGDTVEFRPYLSMKDGAAEFGPDIIDISRLLLESPSESDTMAYDLRDFLREKLIMYE